jgi:hypothetical protein
MRGREEGGMMGDGTREDDDVWLKADFISADNTGTRKQCVGELIRLK